MRRFDIYFTDIAEGTVLMATDEQVEMLTFDTYAQAVTHIDGLRSDGFVPNGVQAEAIELLLRAAVREQLITRTER